ncbi:MAG: DNA polymerase III subunit delta [Phycisphaerales bacterium]
MAKSAASSIPPAAPIAVLYGEERFLQLDHTERHRAALTKAHEEIDTVVFDGQSTNPADILDECRSLSLMQRHKLVIVDNADLLLKAADDDGDAPGVPTLGRRGHAERTAREMFETYAKSPEPSACLLLRAGAWRAGNLDKAIAAAGGTVVECEPYAPQQAMDWAAERAKARHRAAIEPDAAALLVDNLGTDLGRLDSELGKLALIAATRNASKPAITRALVSEMVGFSREEEAWSLQRDLLGNDANHALSNLHDALNVSRHNPVLINLVYLDLARKLDGVCRAVAAGEQPRVRLWGESARIIPEAARRMKPAQTAALLQAAVQADHRQKSGQGDPVHILEALTLKFVGAV